VPCLVTCLVANCFNFKNNTLGTNDPDGRTCRQIIAGDSPGRIIDAYHPVIVDDGFGQGEGTSDVLFATAIQGRLIGCGRVCPLVALECGNRDDRQQRKYQQLVLPAEDSAITTGFLYGSQKSMIPRRASTWVDAN